MIRKSCDEHRFIPVLATLLVMVSLASAAELKPEELVAKHLDSIGTAEARKAIKSRAVEGTVQYKLLVGGAGTMDGKAVVVSEQGKLRLLFKFSNNIYKGEQVVSDGNRIEVAATTQEKTRSPLGDYMYTQDAAIHEGLLGGVLSTAWPLLDLDAHKAKVYYQGLKNIDGHQVYDLRYKPKKGSDQEIDLFFDQETYRHVMTVYKLSIHPTLSRGVTYQGQQVASGDEVQSRQQETRYRVEERFSDFKTADGITMPMHYSLHFSRELQSGATSVSEWDVAINAITENAPLDPRNFEPK
jgi:outer membrane lipoprotein-sorting protein